MNREEIKKAVADALVGFARSEAEAAIKSIDLDDVQKLVEAQMKNLTDPLEAEIQITTSWWVKSGTGSTSSCCNRQSKPS